MTSATSSPAAAPRSSLVWRYVSAMTGPCVPSGRRPSGRSTPAGTNSVALKCLSECSLTLILVLTAQIRDVLGQGLCPERRAAAVHREQPAISGRFVAQLVGLGVPVRPEEAESFGADEHGATLAGLRPGQMLTP